MAGSLYGFDMNCILGTDWAGLLIHGLDFTLFFLGKITPSWFRATFPKINLAVFDGMINQIPSLDHIGKAPRCSIHQPIIISSCSVPRNNIAISVSIKGDCTCVATVLHLWA